MKTKLHIRRGISALSTALFIGLLFVSCTLRPTAPPSSETDGPPTTTDSAQNAWDALPYISYDGYSFRIVLRDMEIAKEDMFQEDGGTGDDGVATAVRNRNVKVEDRFGVSLVPVVRSTDFTDMVSLFAGDAEYDLILPHARYAALYAGGGYLLDWNTIPGIRLDGSWWDQNARASLSISHRLFYMTGDISYWSYGATNMLLFNKRLFDDLNLTYPYQTVKDRSWTLDEFETLVKEGPADLNGDGMMDAENDRFGYMTMGFIGDVQAYHATGNTVVSKDIDDIPYISYMTTRAETVWQWYSDLIGSDACYFQDRLVSYFDTDAVKGFRDGRSLFTDINTINVAEMRKMDDDFGILPWPTLAEGEPYLTNVDAGMHLFCVPYTTVDPERTGLILEGLAVLGQQTVIPEYMEKTVRYKQTRDDESFEMLDLIFAGRVYDLGYYNVELTGAVGQDEAIANNFKHLTENKIKSMSLVWARSGEAAEAYLQTYLQKLEKAVNP